MKNQKYNFSPSLLNSFSLFLSQEGWEKEGVVIPYVTFDDLINSINKVPFATTEAQQRGIDFEDAVISLAKGDETQLLGRTPQYHDCLIKVRDKLPDYFFAQKAVKRQYNDIMFYGFCDVVGGGRVIDIKTTSQYQFGKFLTSFQNLYLWALEPSGYTTMEYVVVANLREVYVETYGLDYNFDELLQKMEFFVEFVEQHKNLITNRKIFNNRYEL